MTASVSANATDYEDVSFDRLVRGSVLLADAVPFFKRQPSLLGDRIRPAFAEVPRQSGSIHEKHEFQRRRTRVFHAVVVPSGNEYDVVGFDRPFGSIHKSESFAADDIK